MESDHPRIDGFTKSNTRPHLAFTSHLVRNRLSGMCAATPSLNRPDVRWSRLLVVGITAVLVAQSPSQRQVTAQVKNAGASDDDEIPEGAVLVHEFPARRPGNAALIDAGLDGIAFAFGRGTSDGPTRTRLQHLLEQRLFVVDSVCELSPQQKRKLRLAGEHDIGRVFDRIEELRSEVQRSGPARHAKFQAAGWQSRAAELRSAMSMGASAEGSLFTKILKNTLTPDQSARYEALRQIERAGGEVSIYPREPDQPGLVAEIDLTGTRFGDADVAHLRHFPRLESLDLRRTAITDAGLNQLTILKDLKRLVVSHTRITDSGIAPLSKLPKLRELVFIGTPVTATAISELQRAVPGLRIEK